MEYLQQFIHTFLHIDTYLNQFVSTYGFWTYAALFLVIFCETGLIITPFLPGDSLLFAAGSIAAQPDNSLHILLLCPLLFTASFLGNQLNYFIAKTIGSTLFTTKHTWLFNKSYLERTHQFYMEHGGKTIILARFLPIIRTFAPFVAGLGTMPCMRFTLYNAISGVVWIVSLLSLGFFLGSLPLIKNNFTWVIYGIIAVSILPSCIGFFRRACRAL